MKQRLDMLLVERGLAVSREQAQKYIRAGWVRSIDKVLDKPGMAIATDAVLSVQQQAPYVSRGGEKLAGALAVLGITVADRVCLDAGISTGGFTDCLLQGGARQVWGIDVGYGQVAWPVRSDPRVILKERTNLRYLRPEDLYQPTDVRPNLAVADLSFISLTKILPALWDLVVPPKETLLLVKPQFECGRDRVGKNGIVRDPQARAEAIAQVSTAAQALGWRHRGHTRSPLPGRTGNWEYWLWLADDGDEAPPPTTWQALAADPVP
ncbi:MAG TPA: TlyA family rRNA (cytidine-2'-O)-methyltransferase [Cyanobacteria bacterium UBA8156]|jgi:23S rRNA (cytidine1920-2'-O)/16S rRNA (cytidine1409-2'-O)-methyltransferase|nr:TlyA family rRNA (cytidine-2'-O)-methyltransferase [Cyanobacteria bacterium UBA8156]